SELTTDYTYSGRVGPDQELRLDAASPGFVRVTGYTIEELEQAGGWKVLIHPDDLPQALKQFAQIAPGKPGVHDIRIRTKGGEPLCRTGEQRQSGRGASHRQRADASHSRLIAAASPDDARRFGPAPGAALAVRWLHQPNTDSRRLRASRVGAPARTAAGDGRV